MVSYEDGLFKIFVLFSVSIYETTHPGTADTLPIAVAMPNNDIPHFPKPEHKR
jgi:hypothetical protein